MRNTHSVKTWPEYFQASMKGIKNFEFREDDRGYQVGDIFISEEWDPRTEKYTNRVAAFLITYILRDDLGLKNKCIMSLERI